MVINLALKDNYSFIAISNFNSLMVFTTSLNELCFNYLIFMDCLIFKLLVFFTKNLFSANYFVKLFVMILFY
jgi:hypothetical protein